MVTVVIPTYNRAERLRLVLEALANGATGGLSVAVHVIDDGSTDATEAMVRGAAGDCPDAVRIHYHRQENAGPAAARNRGIGLARTEHVAFLDDDCVPQPGWLPELLAGFTDAEVAAVSGRFMPPVQPSLVARLLRMRGANVYPSSRRPFDLPFGGNCAYRREVLTQFGGFATAFRHATSEDADLAARVKASGRYRFQYQPGAVVHDYNVCSVRELLSRAYVRGQEKVIKRARQSRPKLPTWGKLALELLAVAACLLAVPFGILLSWRYLRRGVPPVDALGMALLCRVERVVHRCGRVTSMLRSLSGRKQVEQTAAEPTPATGRTRALAAD